MLAGHANPILPSAKPLPVRFRKGLQYGWHSGTDHIRGLPNSSRLMACRSPAPQRGGSDIAGRRTAFHLYLSFEMDSVSRARLDAHFFADSRNEAGGRLLAAAHYGYIRRTATSQY